MKKMFVNVRFGSVHLQSGTRFPWLSLHRNPGHMPPRSGLPKTKHKFGEFRSQPGWKVFQVYSLFGRA